MPTTRAEWINEKLVIPSFDLSSVMSNRQGQIKRIFQMDVSTRDVNLDGVSGFELSFGGKEGMSGGPLLSHESSEVVGLMSFGLPVNVRVKSQLFAISTQEILSRVHRDGT